MSKTSKKNGNLCSYIMLRGDREGEECKNPCRGNRCKYHNEKRQTYLKKKNKQKQRKNNKDSHKKMIRKCKTINMKNLDTYLLKVETRHKRLEYVAKEIIYHMRALQNVLNIESERLANMKQKYNTHELYGPYKDKYPTDKLIRNDKGESVFVPIEYESSELEKFKKRLDSLQKRRDLLVVKLKQSIQYINTLKKRQNEVDQE